MSSRRIEAAAVVEAGERVVPGVVAHDVEAQREHAQREHERAVEVVVLERGLRVEAGRRDEQLVVVGAERPAAGAEDLAADLALLEHHRRVFERELLDERVERAVDERDAGVGASRWSRGAPRSDRSSSALHPRVPSRCRTVQSPRRERSPPILARNPPAAALNPPWCFPAVSTHSCPVGVSSMARRSDLTPCRETEE